jgi:hypothetical protein
MARLVNRLSPTKVNNAKIGLHADGGGLYLQVTDSGGDSITKSWFFRFAGGGRDVRHLLRREETKPQQFEARAQWQSTMKAFVFPTIGDRPVAEVTTGEILDGLQPIWFEKPETAKTRTAAYRVCIQIGNCARPSGARLALRWRGPGTWDPHRQVNHHRALHYSEVPTFITPVRASGSWPATRFAFDWLILTATRSGETRLAR